MKKTKIILLLLLSIMTAPSFGQEFDRIYQGWWESTSWTFEFESNGTYNRSSSGHYGNTTVKGTYKVFADTIQLTTGYENSHRTVNEYYLMEGDSIIIDLYLRYDYKEVSGKNSNVYNSKIRNVKYPQIESNDEDLKSELEKILKVVFNSNEMKDFYHFDKLKDRQLLIADYGFLKASIEFDELEAVFKARSEIQDDFFIEFEDINLNPDRVDIELKIKAEGVGIWFTFYKQNGEWKFKEPSIIEK